MAYETIRCEARDGVMVVTLDRPERLNAWTWTMGAELVSAIKEADTDRSIGAVLLTGAGRAFCAGADMKAVLSSGAPSEDDPESMRQWPEWVDLVRSTKPLVAAVNGAAVGLGLTMILPFDRIVVSDRAQLSLNFIKLALVPELASSYFLPQRVGFGTASDLMLSGRRVSAEEALKLRLVDELVPAEELVDTALTRARAYGENPSRQLRWTKQLLSKNSSDPDAEAVQRRELALLDQCYESDEHKATVAAFLELDPARLGRAGTLRQ